MYRVKNKIKAVTTGGGGEFQRERIGLLFKKYVNLNNRKNTGKMLESFQLTLFDAVMEIYLSIFDTWRDLP